MFRFHYLLPPLILVLLFAGPAQGITYTAAFECAAFGDDCDIAITDNAPVDPVTSSIFVPAGDGPDCTLEGVQVRVEIEHTYVGDLVVLLTHVDTATSIALIDRPRIGAPGSCHRDNIDVLLTEEFPAPPVDTECDTSPPTTIDDSAVPSDSFAPFMGIDPSGEWVLTLFDYRAADTGSLVSWELILEFPSDTDGDGIVDCYDPCPNDSGLIDSDGDGVPDCLDGCPNDPNKRDAGPCGCGSPDDDSDGDGIADCVDLCPDDGDSDGDGMEDCLDECPDDPNKTSAGLCGCGEDDVDTDGDGWLDCFDNCPADLNSDQADADGNGVGDACDVPAGSPACTPGWMFLPMAGVGMLSVRRTRRRRRG